MTFMSFTDDTWSPVGDADREKFFEQISPVDGRLALDASVALHHRPLPIYDNVSLLCLTSEAWAPELRICYLTDQGNLFRLNGTSPPIHEVNAKAPVRINDDNVLFYLSFFGFFVRGEEGPFYILHSLEDSLLPEGFAAAGAPGNPTGPTPAQLFRQPRLFGRSDEGHWRVSALVFYANAVFFSDFLIQPTGMVEMVHDEPVIANLGCRVSAPLTPPAG